MKEEGDSEEERIGKWKSQKLGPFWVIYLQEGFIGGGGGGGHVLPVLYGVLMAKLRMAEGEKKFPKE